jgi:two-component system chemotaxis response regulator CheB
MDGITCLNRIMVERPCPVVMVSQRTEEGARETIEALELGAIDFIPKPEGAVSLEIDTLAPRLIEKVRAASTARIRPTLRLADRVRAKVRTEARRAPRTTRVSGIEPGHVPPIEACAETGLVLIGTSTGGPQALDTVLGALPADFPWPVLVAQHMPSSFTGALARRLDNLCALKVVEVVGPTPVTPGTIYIGRGDADMVIRRQRGALIASAAPASATYRWHPSVDRLVASALEVVSAERMVAVLMTGMGNDGATTMAEVRRRGGLTIAEAEESAVVWGMPGELVKADGASIIVPLERIASALLDSLASR